VALPAVRPTEKHCYSPPVVLTGHLPATVIRLSLLQEARLNKEIESVREVMGEKVMREITLK
jgi:hypothetical protein